MVMISPPYMLSSVLGKTEVVLRATVMEDTAPTGTTPSAERTSTVVWVPAVGLLVRVQVTDVAVPVTGPQPTSPSLTSIRLVGRLVPVTVRTLPERDMSVT